MDHQNDPTPDAMGMNQAPTMSLEHRLMATPAGNGEFYLKKEYYITKDSWCSLRIIGGGMGLAPIYTGYQLKTIRGCRICS